MPSRSEVPVVAIPNTHSTFAPHAIAFHFSRPVPPYQNRGRREIVLINPSLLSPRDGKNITPTHLTAALEAGFNMSHPLAVFLTSVIKKDLLPKITPPGSAPPLTSKSSSSSEPSFDLTYLRLHNAIEHDVSLSRLDWHDGDNTSLVPEMLESILVDAAVDTPESSTVTAKSLGRSRRRRARESEAAGVPKLGIKLAMVAVFNWGSALLVLEGQGPKSRALAKTGNGGVERGEFVSFMMEERLPEVPLRKRLTLPMYFWSGLRVLCWNYLWRP
jgi:hypothetical protein